MRVPILRTAVDERFLAHRRRSTGLAGIAGGVLAIGLFEYHLFADGVWNWDLLAVGLTMVAVKLASMLWLRLSD